MQSEATHYAPLRAHAFPKPRLVTRAEAARFCGVSPSCFSNWVQRDIMPASLAGTRRWDLRAIEQRLDEMNGYGVKNSNSADHSLSAEEALRQWKISKEKGAQ